MDVNCKFNCLILGTLTLYLVLQKFGISVKPFRSSLRLVSFGKQRNTLVEIFPLRLVFPRPNVIKSFWAVRFYEKCYKKIKLKLDCYLQGSRSEDSERN